MKKILGFFCLVASLASCDVTIDSHEPVNGADSSAIGFNVYVNRGVTTKAGYKGDLTTAKLENEAGGFGVFAYYGDGALYNETSKPDFMYNQQVTYNSTYRVWEYKPLKYWPNEYGDAAGSQSADRLTFFAYAPYVPVTPSTGIVTATGDDAETGILGLSRNISPGDPMVMYGSTFTPGTGVDLCWGVALEDFFSSVDGNNNHVNKGEPFIDVVKPKTGDHLKFEFNHALTQLNITVDAAIDVETAGANDTLAAGSKIYVRSVTFTGLTTRGSLNLNSKAGKPAWFDIAGTGRLSRDPVTVYDGRSDGQEGVATASDVTEFPQGLNPNIIQKGVPTSGVTNETVNLFANENAEAPIMVIPVAGVPMEVTIVYDIETADDHLAGFLSDGATHGVSVENRITKRIKTDEGDLVLDPGKKYTINLHLGLTSVKFEAKARDWDNSLEYNGTAYLPENASSLGTVTITTDGTTPLTSLTTWKGETMASAPQVSVVDDQGQPVTEFDKEWTSSDTNVATVAADGKVTAVAPGIATLPVKVTKGDKSSSKAFTVYINEVTGIVSVEPASQNIVKGGTANLTAKLTLNGGQQVNGTITTDPGLTWSSDPGITVASNGWSVDGSTLTVTATASVASTVAEGDHTVTATIGTLPSASATLTCVEKISIDHIDLGAPSTTVWLSQGASTPEVTVMGTDNNPLTSGVTKAWTSDNESVATVTDAGVVTLHGTGEAKLTVTATLAASATTAADTETADFMVYVNAVTGVSLTPTTSNILIGSTLEIKASLTLNNGNDVNGTISSWPTVAWTSDYEKVTVTSPSTAAQVGSDIVAATTATAANDAAANTQTTITATVDAAFTASSTSSVTQTCTLTCSNLTGSGSGVTGGWDEP